MREGYLAIIISMLIWGSIGIFARMAGQDPLITVTYRSLFAAAALTVGELIRHALRRGPDPAAPGEQRWGLLLLSGAALAADWLFFFKAVATTSVSNAVLSYYSAPVLVALASPLLLKEPLEKESILATGLSVLGIFIMLYQPGQQLNRADLVGIGCGLLAALFYAMVTISGRWLEKIPAPRLVLVQSATSALVLLPVVLLGGIGGTPGGMAALGVPRNALALLALMGVVHTALALILYFEGLRKVKVQHIGVLAYLDPVSAILFAFLFLGEIPSPSSLAGGLLVLGGSALLLRSKRPAEGRQAA